MLKFSVKSHNVLKPIFDLEKGNVCIEEEWSQYGKMLTVNLVERYIGVLCSILILKLPKFKEKVI